MAVTTGELRDKLDSFKYLGLFRRSSEQTPTSYWKKCKRDYSPLTRTQKARRMDK